MATCEWCKKTAKNPNVVSDSFGDTSNVCDECKASIDNHECIKCGTVTDLLLKGRCMNCYQVILQSKAKKKEEVLTGMIGADDEDNVFASDVEFTDKEYEQWLTMGNTVSPSDIKGDIRLRRLWIIVKLSATGLDAGLINEYIEDVEKLLDVCFSKLINNKCRIIIANTPENKKKVKSGEIIEYLNDVYILKA